jgi:pilus biogenesis lipoprotein CpaD
MDRPMRTTARTRLSRSAARAHRGAIAAAAAAVLALLLAGCGTTTPPGIDLGDYEAAPRDLVRVASIIDSHRVRLGRNGYVSRSERDSLAAFVAYIAANRPESLRVALRGPATLAQFRAVAALLAADGVDPRTIVRADRRLGPHAPQGSVAGSVAGNVTVAVERAVAVQPACPGWVAHISAPADNRTDPNFGCSDVSNFAAMVSDPHDLIVGDSSIYADGERAATSVANYRADKVKSLLPENEQFTIIPSGG